MRNHLFITVLVFLLGSAGLVAQNKEFRLGVDVANVPIQVEVLDANGRPVTDLTKDDFAIYEDGRLQQIQSFSSLDSPYSILALFDCTSSLREHWRFLETAMNSFVNALRPQDHVSVVAFGSGTETLLDLTPRDKWSGTFPIRLDSPACGKTDFYGSLKSVAKRMQGVSGRTGVIVFSDGIDAEMKHKDVTVGGLKLRRFVDSGNDGDFQDVLKPLRTGKTLFYFVAANTDLNATGLDGGYGAATFSPLTLHNRQQVRSRLEQLASASGGRVVFPIHHSDYASLFEQIARELGASYSIAYVPPSTSPPGATHRIEVRVRRPDVRVRQSRESYGREQ
jgi:VWFA-related protein